MRHSGNSILVFSALVLSSLLACCNALAADSSSQPTALPADSLVVKCTSSQLWDQDAISVSELHGPVSIELDHTKMSADNAVVWINPNPGGPADSHRVQIALIGSARLQQHDVLRLDRRLLVNAIVTGKIELLGERKMGEDEQSALYVAAADLRSATAAQLLSTTNPSTNPTTTATSQPTPANPVPNTGPSPLRPLAPLPPLPGATQPAGPTPSPWANQAPVLEPLSRPTSMPSALPQRFVQFDGDFMRTITPDGNIAAVCSNGVNLRYQDNKGNLLEFQAHDMVLFTNLKQLKGAGEGEDARQFVADHVIAAYFDGDVRVYATPIGAKTNELRMRAERVYYELDTDRAIMTDVLFHMVDLTKQIPIFMRAKKLRQLSQGEFKIEGLGLTNSAFALPTYSLEASNAYVRIEDTGDPVLGDRMTYTVDNAVVQAFGLPVFYDPGMAGETTTKGSPFRTIDIVDDGTYGDGFRSRWGLFELAKVVPPKNVDATFTADYFSKRGPGGGADVLYSGGFVEDATKQPWNFVGDFHSFFVDDHGFDVIGAARANEYPEDHFRGRAIFEHTEFFPSDWEAQVRLGYLSDSVFMVQWFNDEFLNGLPVDDEVYLKHSSGSEQYSFLAQAQPNRAVSVADEEEENREVSRLPELKYYRVGDSLATDHFSFFSEDSVSELKFVQNTQSLTRQGFSAYAAPGEPAFAYTGDPGNTTLRGDARQELDFPIDAGRFKAVPYLFGRYTGYSESVVPPLIAPQSRTIPKDVVAGSQINRLMGGGGLRLTTDFWKTDDTIESDLFDIHRVRHIISPEVNLFGSASNVDQSKLFIYDPQIDAVNDVEVVQLALRQRWQTKRGGPGRWRSVDFFTLNLYGNFFANQPENRFRDPVDFRGLFMYSSPEFSVPRNSANMDSTWRISDSMTVLSSVQENLDRDKLATAAIGVAILREARLSYYISNRYIADLNSNVITFEINYKLDNKYTLQATESLDLAQNKDVYYTFTLTRAFDNLNLTAQLYYDQTTNNHGFSIGIHPLGSGGGFGSNQLTPPP